ncbi:MAG: class C beta-lactamase-related serine hydrolase [Bacteroidetes bacterium]|nr:MAG: class C beta-lactamase-related serine hydrolase [Bacteroidota bacterium]MBL1145187.1 class C beta-lactamase-related serine hydrolase [Bacteroidota bacterium]NOG57983.1 serine hydrolase [Bacteroidota bacterium]
MRKIALAVLSLSLLASCTVGRFFVYNFANITDYKKFPKRELVASQNPFMFEVASKELGPKTISIEKGKSISFNQFLEKSNTVAFIIIRNDTILYENYNNKYERESITTSFSMAKSITSMLVGFAIQDQLIQSVDEKITKYIPELANEGFDEVTIEHLLQMTSGMKFNESYVNPFGHAAVFYYGRNLEKACLKLKLENTPGQSFNYQSGSTQLLGLLLDRALKPSNKTVTDYLQEKIWTPLQMEFPASWSIDKKKDGLEKTFCCVNARAIDFAKLGKFYLDKGKWNGQQLLNEAWINNSTQIDTTKGSVAYYQYQWWLSDSKSDYYAQGILGQYIYINPDKNIIMVRLGKNHGKAPWVSVFKSLANKY